MDVTPVSKFRTFLFGKVLGVERREIVAVLWSFLYFFCLLSSYYILRPVRETMAVGSGPNTIPFLFVGTFTAMLLVTPVFGWIASRYPRRTFLPWVYLFFAANIIIFWALFIYYEGLDLDPVWLGRAFFVWISVFNLFVVSVFWSFMADIYNREQGRRLFGLISSGGSIGALLGGVFTSAYVERIGFENLFPISAAILLIAIFCIHKLRRWVTDDGQAAASGTVLGGSAFSGMTHVTSSTYFVSMAVTTILANLLGTALYLFAAQLVEIEIPDADSQTRFFSNMNVAQNFLTIIFQMFVVKQVVARFGIGTALALLPVISVVGFAVLALYPVLGVVAALTVLRRAIGFGFGKPSSDMLYSVVSREDKYKTKNFIDTAVYRAGDLVGIWTVRILGPIGMTGISLVMLPFAVGWSLIALWQGREYRRRAKALKEAGTS